MANRRLVLGLVAVLLAAGCGGGGGGGDAAAVAAQATDVAEVADHRTVVALGLGRASGPPDTMVVSLSIRTDGRSAAETMDTASLRTQQLLDTARGQGVADEDLQTTNVGLFPRFNEAGTRIVGYSADNSFTVRYRDLATAGVLLDGLVGVGGDFVRVQGLGLEIDDPTALLDEARDDAVERARAQAGQLAQAAGVELGDVRRVAEVPVGSTLADFDESSSRLGSPTAQDAAVPVPIAGGSHEVSLQVAVVYDIGDA